MDKPSLTYCWIYLNTCRYLLICGTVSITFNPRMLYNISRITDNIFFWSNTRIYHSCFYYRFFYKYLLWHISPLCYNFMKFFKHIHICGTITSCATICFFYRALFTITKNCATFILCATLIYINLPNQNSATLFICATKMGVIQFKFRKRHILYWTMEMLLPYN